MAGCAFSDNHELAIYSAIRKINLIDRILVLMFDDPNKDGLQIKVEDKSSASQISGPFYVCESTQKSLCPRLQATRICWSQKRSLRETPLLQLPIRYYLYSWIFMERWLWLRFRFFFFLLPESFLTLGPVSRPPYDFFSTWFLTSHAWVSIFLQIQQ